METLNSETAVGDHLKNGSPGILKHGEQLAV